jgi:two-component system, OmpR family, KDP operon response regulator KdpE
MKFSALKVLIVDDEPEIRRFLRASLKARSYDVLEAGTAAEALAAAAEHHPGLIILDLGLPDMDGVEVMRAIRASSQTPVIILSVRDREFDKIDALDAGADDYLTKPFGMGELLARIRGVLRRVTVQEQRSLYRAGDLSIDLERREVRLVGKEVGLTPTEFGLLSALVSQAGKVITHRQLIHQVWGTSQPWGTSFEDESRLLRVNISNLRKKIEPDPNHPVFLLTELGVGYRFKDES